MHRIAAVTDAFPAAAEAVRQSHAQGGQSATLIFPADYQYGTAPLHDSSPRAAEDGSPPRTEASRFDLVSAAQTLTQSKHAVFLLGGGGPLSGLGERAQIAVARLCGLLGSGAFAETFPARAERGQGLPVFDRLPYFPEPARAVLDAADLVVLVGAQAPITYFGYEGHPSALVPADRLLTLALPGENAADRLEALAEHLDAPAYKAPEVPLPAAPQGPLTPLKIADVLARHLPARAIVSVEGGTCGYPFYAASAAAPPHTTLTNTGGAIGQGLPVAMGAAIACPDRKVLALLSDGSTQYTIQTLWSLAHENLDVVVLIAANHQYAILRNELRRGNVPLGERAADLTSLESPRIDWVQLARAYGVRSSRAHTAEELSEQLGQAVQRRGPTLIEMAL